MQNLADRLTDLPHSEQNLNEELVPGMSDRESLEAGAFQFGTKHKYSSKMNC